MGESFPPFICSILPPLLETLDLVLDLYLGPVLGMILSLIRGFHDSQTHSLIHHC